MSDKKNLLGETGVFFFSIAARNLHLYLYGVRCVSEADIIKQLKTAIERGVRNVRAKAEDPFYCGNIGNKVSFGLILSVNIRTIPVGH